MNPADADRGDDLFSSLLAAYDEALALGSKSEPSASSPPDDLTPRLQRAQEFLARLEREWPRAAPVAAESTPFPSPTPGERQFGRFQIRKELGRGGCGVVFLAFDPVLRREIALKVPLPAVLVSPALRQRFLREAQAAAGLDHPNLVSVYEADEIPPICYIASTYCEGPTLAAWLRDHPGPVPPPKAARLIAAVSEGIAHAHQRRILHRDLKPSNILLTPAQNAGQSQSSRDALADWDLPGAATNGGLEVIPRVTDFGLAKVMEAELEGSGCRTRSGAIIGTPQYMPPEQAEGRHDEFGPTADVYSLGAILYELLTGQVPFNGKTDVEILRRIHSEEVVPPRRLRRDIPRDLETICLKCLEKEPRKRYPDANSLGQDLRCFLAKRPIRARRTPAWERALKWTRRHPAVAGLSALSSAVLICLLVVAWYFSSVTADVLARMRVIESESAAAKLQHQLQHQADILRRDYDRDMPQLQGADGTPHGRSAVLPTTNKYWPRAGLADLRGFEWYYWRRFCEEKCFWLHGHTGKITAVAVDPEGKLIASASTDQSVKLWDRVKGELVGSLSHPAVVSCLAFSPDGKTLATGGDEQAVRLWDIALRQQRNILDAQKGAVRALAFSPDGSVLVSAGAMLCTWDAAHGKRLATANSPAGFWSVAFAPNGKTLATSGLDPSITFWNAESLRMLSTLRGAVGAGDPRRLVAGWKSSRIGGRRFGDVLG